MKVSQLIEALQQMPQDAEVITHANNHTAGHDDSMRVGAGRLEWSKETQVVVIGNWCSYSLLCWRDSPKAPKMQDESFGVLRYGNRAGQLIKQRHRFLPAHEELRTERKRVQEEYRLEDE